MRILLTGANGFIGSELTSDLLKAGHDVAAAVRDPAKFLRRFPGTTVVLADFNVLTTSAQWLPLLTGLDCVINCAGILQSRAGQSASSIHTHAPLALFQAAHSLGVRKIIQISAVSADADTEYAQSKSAADKGLMAMDADWVILRPSLVYGRQAYGGTAMLRALAACPLSFQ